MGHDLIPVTDAEHRNGCCVGCADQLRLGGDRVGDVRPVDAPLAAERDHQLVALDVGPIVEVLALTLGEREALPTKSIDDEPSVGVGRVGDQQRSHGHYGTR